MKDKKSKDVQSIQILPTYTMPKLDCHIFTNNLSHRDNCDLTARKRLHAEGKEN